ncbi:hypothetical protein B0H19DRAFT_1077844 [Mycena capillaripes]|nr:hypothetical protein B0H19DRAFT_1077844 [Mycena capillaripes]
MSRFPARSRCLQGGLFELQYHSVIHGGARSPMSKARWLTRGLSKNWAISHEIESGLLVGFAATARYICYLGACSKQYGLSDLQCEGWSNFISDCVKEELRLFLSDLLTLIKGEKSVATAAAAASATSSLVCSRLPGALREGAAGSRQPSMSINAANTTISSLPGISGTRSSLSGLDHLMAIPTPFTFGSSPASTNPRKFTFGNMASSLAVTLRPLNSLGEGSSCWNIQQADTYADMYATMLCTIVLEV